jgi:uncharacterized membrane protein YhhN
VTAAASVLLGVAIVAAIVDWLAVARGNRGVEYVAKPAATLALVGVAATLDAAHGDTQAVFVAALLASLAGDVFLMLPGDRFVAGLASFLVAQLLFTVGFALHGGDAEAYAVGAVVAALLVTPLAVRFVRALHAAGRDALVVPVVAYMSAISAMLVSAIASGNAFAVVGAVAFVGSDSLIAETRFVQPRPWGPVTIMVTYHVALLGLVLSLLDI